MTEIAQDAKTLRELKLQSYLELIGQWGEYRRRAIYKGRATYPLHNVIHALTSYYDMVYSEAQEHKEEYEDTIRFIEGLQEEKKNVQYADVLPHLRRVMKLSKEIGVSTPAELKNTAPIRRTD